MGQKGTVVSNVNPYLHTHSSLLRYSVGVAVCYTCLPVCFCPGFCLSSPEDQAIYLRGVSVKQNLKPHLHPLEDPHPHSASLDCNALREPRILQPEARNARVVVISEACVCLQRLVL